MSHYDAVAVKNMPPKQEEVLYFTDFTEILNEDRLSISRCDFFVIAVSRFFVASLMASW